MSRKKLSKNGQCVYCGQIGLITDDHIPPKNLFSKPRPSNLIKIPSCNKCHGQNNQVSKDDEYFRLMVTLREDTADHPEVEKVLPTVLRSLGKPTSQGFTSALLRNRTIVNLRTTGGLYVGMKPAYNVDLQRLDSVAERITKGLFYFEKGFRLPNEYEVFSYSESGFRDITNDFKNDLQEKIIQPLMATELKIIGNNVFSYRVSFTKEDPNTSAWLLVFYDKVAFLSLTLPREVTAIPS